MSFTFEQVGNGVIFNGDCLEVMPSLIEQGVKVDAIITDIPYGTTACKWDNVIPFEPMWNCLNSLISEGGGIILFGCEPFSSKLRCSNLKMYKYDWIWKKNTVDGFLNAKCRPLKSIENICVFSKSEARAKGKNMIYNPQGLIKIDKECKETRNEDTLEHNFFRNSRNNKTYIQEYKNYPTETLVFNRDKNKLHPTQKPVALMEYLVKTYTNENDLVLDFTMGSGTTCVACQNLNRKFIGIELDQNYYNIAKQRIQEAIG